MKNRSHCEGWTPEACLPERYIILKRVQCHECCILKVYYRDATNCEGNKILVYRGTYYDIDQSDGLDPHFAEEGGPIARFHPSQEGWENAIKFAGNL